MYKIRRAVEIAGAHHLTLNYESKCKNCHGHNWKIIVELSAMILNQNGMILDFGVLKQIMNEVITDKFDHKDINETVYFNPTAENLAHHICYEITNLLRYKYSIELGSNVQCTRVEIFESSNNVAIFECDYQE